MSFKKRTLLLAISLGVVGLLISGLGLTAFVNVGLKREAHSQGMDWAHHLERQINEITTQHVHANASETHTSIDKDVLIELLHEVFAVGHIFQIDYINAYCHCDLSLSSLVDGHGSPNDSSIVGPSEVGHTTGPAARTLTDKFVNHLLRGEAHHIRPRSLDLGGRKVPFDEDLVASIFETNEHPIFIRKGNEDSFPNTYAEIFHPVMSNGKREYMLRVLVDLEDQAVLYWNFMIVAVAVSLGLLLSAVGYPTLQYMKAMKQKQTLDKRAAFLANHDVLTNLKNRNNFQETVSDILWGSVEKKQHCVLFVFDLNDFKTVNDLHGHQLGDDILCAFANLLKRHAPVGSYVARLGGDEFVVIVDGLSEISGVRDILSDLPSAVELPATDRHPAVSATIAGGFACFPDDAKTATDLVQMADLALYAAKPNRAGEIRGYEPYMKEEFYGRLSVLEEFRIALDKGQIEPFYQPIVNIETGQVAGLEALARWRHPDRGILTPFVFGTVFENPELSGVLGRCILNKISQDMAIWQTEDVPFEKVNLNVVNGDLRDKDFANTVLDCISTLGLDPEMICIEVTENCLFGAEKSLYISHLEKLRDAGCNVALDDFGTGYSSITQLKEIPANMVKIDKSFIDNILDSDADRSIIKALADIGDTMNFKVVLEGIETADQLNLVRNMGFELAQGYYYSKPVQASEIPVLIEQLNGMDNLENKTRKAG